VPFVIGEDGDVADLRLPLDPNKIDCAKQPAGLADGGGNPGERAWMVLDPHANDSAERRGRMHTTTVRRPPNGSIGDNYVVDHMRASKPVVPTDAADADPF